MTVADRARRLSSSPSLYAYVDQGQVSLGNLLTQILLARTLVPARYGELTLLIGVILLVRALHAALVTYPVTVWTATATEEDTRRHAGRSIAATAWWCLPGAVIIGVVCAALGRLDVWPMASVALAAGLLQETARRVLMARLRFRAAIVGDAVSYLGQAVVLFGVLRATHSLVAVFAAMALTSGLALLVQVAQLRPSRPTEVRAWLTDALGFGRWMLGTNMIQPLTIQFFPWVLAGFHGTAATAEFQVILTMLGVSNPVMATASNLVVPIAARAATEGDERVRHLVVRIGMQSFAVLLPFFAVMLVIPTWLLRTVYGADSPYVALGGEMRLLTIANIALLCLNVLGNYFVGIGRSKATFVAQVWGAGVALTLGVLFTWQIRVAGACIGLFCTNLAQVLWLWRLYRSPSFTAEAVQPT